jgi:hypothetical protein
VSVLSPAAARALELWQQRMDAMRDGRALPAGAYRRELAALVACSDEWDQVAEAKQQLAIAMLADDDGVPQ